MEKRENAYDLLRIISTIAVVLIHVSASWLDRAIKDISENGLCIADMQAPAAICIYNSVSRFAVPCFIMLSGAFLLDNEKNADYKAFYSKTFGKIGIPAIIFSLLYILYRLLLCFVGENSNIFELLRDIPAGLPMYHMWYLYMMAGVYAMVPVIIRFKNSISERTFYRISFVFLIMACISSQTADGVRLMWDVGRSFEYLGYFMVGYSIRKMCKNKDNRKGCIAVSGGLLFELAAAGMVYWQMENTALGESGGYQIVSPYSPLIVFASLLIWKGFTLLDINKDFKGCSDLTLYIYLIHVGVWEMVLKIFVMTKGREYLTDLNGAIWIPVFAIFVFIASCFLGRAYLWIWKKIDDKNRMTEFILRMVHLL